MNDDSTRRAAEEYLAARQAEEGQRYDEDARVATPALALLVWKRVTATILAQCGEWNAVTKEQTLTCKETALGDLRVWCAGRSQVMTVHFDSRRLLVTVKNTARLDHEKDVVLGIEGYAVGSGRDARLVRNNHPVNLDLLILGELRVLAGIGRQTTA